MGRTYLADNLSKYEIDGLFIGSFNRRDRIIEMLDIGYGYHSIVASDSIADLWGVRKNPERVTCVPGDKIIVLTATGDIPEYEIVATLEEVKEQARKDAEFEAWRSRWHKV